MSASAPFQSPNVANPVARTFRALRHRNFQLFFFGQFLSLIGTFMQSVAQSWLIWRLAGSERQGYLLLGLLNFCQFTPVLVLGLFGGVVADRFNRHRIVIATQALMLVQAVILTALTWTGVIQPWQLMALALMLGVANAFDMPGRQAFLVQMVAREDLANAIALNSSVFNGARIIGPALAGLAVARWGEAWCFLLNAVSYLFVLGGLLAMRLPRHVPQRGAAPAWERLREGFRYAWITPHVRGLLTLMLVTGFFGVSYMSFLAGFADEILHSDARGLGVLMGCAGVGALGAAVAMAYRSGIAGLGRVVPLMAIGFGGAIVAFSTSRTFWVACVLLAFAGFFMMTQMASTNTLLQSLVPDRLRGRVMSLYTVTFIGTAPVGSLLMGWLAARIGLPLVLAGGGFLVLVAGVLFRGPLARALAEARPPELDGAAVPHPAPATLSVDEAPSAR